MRDSETETSKLREGDRSRLSRRLEGDLDNILLKALQKERLRRYTSVEQFSEDLLRHLEHKPVVARPATLHYRTGKFIRRHPGSVVAVILISVSILAGLATTLLEMRVALDAQREAAALIQQSGRSSDAAGRAALAPQMILFSYAALVLLAAALYLRARLCGASRGAFAGAAVCTAAWTLYYDRAWSSGVLRSAVPGLNDPVALFPVRLVLVAGTSFAAVMLLLLWRTGRRFGWKGQAVLTVALALWMPLREHVWMKLMGIIISSREVRTLLIEACLWLAALAIGLGVMRIFSGLARRDPLARSN